MKDSPPASAFAKRSDLVSLSVVTLHVAVVFGPVLVAARLGPGWWLVLCWLWFGWTMNGLLNLMHEAAHYHVFRAPKANDFLGRFLLGPLSHSQISTATVAATGIITADLVFRMIPRLPITSTLADMVLPGWCSDALH